MTIDEEGVARIRDVYKVSATVGGYLDRFPLEVGDPVKRNETVIAEIRPSEPSFLDERTRRELEASVGAATASVRLAEAELSRAQSDLRMRESDLDRSEKLQGEWHHLRQGDGRGAVRRRIRRAPPWNRRRPACSFAAASLRAPKRG